VSWPDLAVLAVTLIAFGAIYALRRRHVNFSVVTLIALAIGVPIGLAANSHVTYIEPIGQIFINILLATVVPLIMVAIISSIVSLGSVEKLRSIGVRSTLWLLATNAIAVVLALGFGLATGIGTGVDESLGGEQLSVLENSVQDFTSVVVGLFPTNIVTDMGANHIIPVILVSVTIAIAYLALAEREAAALRPFKVGVEALKLVIFRAVGYVIALTPYAIVALTATVVANASDLGDQFLSLLGLLALVWVTCIVDTFAVNGVLLTTFAQVNPVRFFKKFYPAQVTAMSTQSSVGTLPVTTSLLTKRVGVHPEVAHFTAPLGTTIGMPGCAGIWPMLVAIWGINAYNIPYTAQDWLVLTLLCIVVSIGTAGVPGTATVAAATVFAAAGLPLEFVAVTLPISTIADMARTATNVTAAAVSATIVARQTELLDDSIFDGDATLNDTELIGDPIDDEQEAVVEQHHPGAARQHHTVGSADAARTAPPIDDDRTAVLPVSTSV
jgi:Na+/H+-dicarboxylate symporter